MWATEAEVRAAWEKQQNNPQIYQAAEMIRLAGFPSQPPLGYAPAQAPHGTPAPGGPGPVYPFPQQAQAPQQQNYPFPLSPMQQLPPVASSEVHHSSQGGKQILIGIVLLIVGIAITAGTHSAATRNGGGTYMIAYGPIVVGVITLFKGIFNLASGK